MTNLLHLTDLHFGRDRDATAHAQRAQALDLLVKILGRLEARWKPNILALSGYLTWKGQPDGYKELAHWLTDKALPGDRVDAGRLCDLSR